MAVKTLKQLRVDRGFTQQQASEYLGISCCYLGFIENSYRGRKPSDKLKEKMSILYNTSINDIFLSIKETKRLKDKNTIQNEAK